MLDPRFFARPIAHRGYHDQARGRVENSRAAFGAAIAHGYGIELDLQLSADGEAVVFHDYDLARLTDLRGPVRQRPMDNLRSIRLSGSDDVIASLPEVLAQVAGRVPLLIELKDQDGAMGADVGALEAAVADALKGYDGPAALMSFNPHSVRTLASLAPDVPRGLVTCAFEAEDWPTLPTETRALLKDIPDYDRVGACFISHDARDLDAPRVATLKADGAKVLCWTIRSPEAEAIARRIADNVTFEGYVA
ncbi:glycerophosphodiester phosphodiesterase family protein [Cognatishimia sp. MH4019]|uniref:glycerophosphodiester phosphodiesterase family protein n=1 Tax=Cognatishimia sp. MH4019 TaxID=2854030 RepID=UPI001CD74977|nr:glycerophosphodiester phosphodiesterase family protein [Cognatishimia sp. MH4019]